MRLLGRAAHQKAAASAVPITTTLSPMPTPTVRKVSLIERSNILIIYWAMTRVQAQRDAGEITLPTTVGQERETNPFVRATDAQAFAHLRAEKDSFR